MYTAIKIIKKKKVINIFFGGGSETMFCFQHNWHKQAFSLWFLFGESLG